MQKLSYLQSANPAYIEELYALYQQNPDSVDSSWRYFFDGLDLGNDLGSDLRAEAPTTAAPVAQAVPTPLTTNEAKVAELIMAYRELGRLLAHLDPLSPPPTSHPLLELSHFGLTAADLSKSFSAGRLIGMGTATLSEILARLHQTYCGSIGVEYTHIQDPSERQWLQDRMEASRNRETLDTATRKHILHRLSESETFERFLHTRYVAQKRFSAEGAESLIPVLDCMIEVGAELGADEFVMGMAHRGRLNVLAHIFGKKMEYIFTEFEGAYKSDTSEGEGDVKYHMGYSADFTTRFGKKVHLSLASNPSHLEFVHPVIEGVARAKQGYRNDPTRTKVIPIAIHGDSAFAGQGVCYETLNLSQLKGYTTGGTLHIVINNQVGFTTSPEDSRSTTYATDVAKMLEVPIFHVNGDDPEALWYIAKLCVEYRQKFKKDIVIDLICYRKHGHNEGDEPAFTQPILYKKIKAHSSPREIYAQALIQSSTVTTDEAQNIIDEITARLTAAQTKTKAEAPTPFISVFEGVWKDLRRADEGDLLKPVKTTVPAEILQTLSEKLNTFPTNFQLHPKLQRFFEARQKAIQQGSGIDWGNGETLAYATLLNEGYGVRISGQDVERGTFTHRHAVLHDFETGQIHTPLAHVSPTQPPFQIHNSSLSETAVLGFEYGYSIADPHVLVIWEAQFGDFANGGQVIIDQFISSSESKWKRMSGITLLLPHGFEGQGPEHSSARLERFLQLCGKHNLSVCNLTTPAQIFHALRRQMKRDFRKPLVIMSPKSLLRHPHAISPLKDFTDAGFQEVIDDSSALTSTNITTASIKRVILCSGKIYYDLDAQRSARKMTDTVILRLEQLYPWPAAQLANILEKYSKVNTLIWAQEEPRNMGAWNYVFSVWNGGLGLFREKVGDRTIHYVGREIGAAPAVGSHKIHDQEQTAIIEKALTL